MKPKVLNMSLNLWMHNTQAAAIDWKHCCIGLPINKSTYDICMEMEIQVTLPFPVKYHYAYSVFQCIQTSSITVSHYSNTVDKNIQFKYKPCKQQDLLSTERNHTSLQEPKFIALSIADSISSLPLLCKTN